MVFSKTFCAAKNSDGTTGILVGVSPKRYPIGEELFFLTDRNGKLRFEHLGDAVAWREGGTVTVEKNEEKILFHLTDDPLTEILEKEATRIADLLENRHNRKEIETASTAAEKDRIHGRWIEVRKTLGYIAEDGTELYDPSDRKIFRGMEGFRAATKEELRHQKEMEKEHPELVQESILLMVKKWELGGRKSMKA